MVRRYAGRVLSVLYVLLVTVWIAGSIVALGAPRWPSGVCSAPYKVWAATWPVWLVMPKDIATGVVLWSFSLCPHEDAEDDQPDP